MQKNLKYVCRFLTLLWMRERKIRRESPPLKLHSMRDMKLRGEYDITNYSFLFLKLPTFSFHSHSSVWFMLKSGAATETWPSWTELCFHEERLVQDGTFGLQERETIWQREVRLCLKLIAREREEMRCNIFKFLILHISIHHKRQYTQHDDILLTATKHRDKLGVSSHLNVH